MATFRPTNGPTLARENPLLRSGFGSTRRRHRGHARAAAAKLTVLLFLLMATALASGCATFRRRGPTPEGIAAAREMTRQGVAAMESGDWQAAEDLLNKAAIGTPDDAATRRSLAEVLWHREAKQQAIEQIEEAVELDPENASLRVRAGEMALATGSHEVALAHAERAVRRDPNLASAWALRGRCFRQMNQPDRSLADLQHALEFAPDDADVLLDVARAYRERGQLTRSLTTIHHLVDTYSPGAEPQQVLLLEGITLLDMGRPQQACEVLAAAVKRGQPTADGLYYLAQAFSDSGNDQQAAVTAEQALSVSASHQPSRQLLAQLAARRAPAEPMRR